MTDHAGGALDVAISAYSCSPGAGSEPGVGFETIRAIATRHNVWVLTRIKNVGALETYFGDHPTEGSVQIIGLDLSAAEIRLKKRLGALGVYWYYDRWQSKARDRLEDLATRQHIDMAHHVTFSSDWARAGAADGGLPFLWGPIGGGIKVPMGLLPSLGLKGAATELARAAGRAAMRRRSWYRRAWESAEVVLVQNKETAALAPPSVTPTLLPHSTAVLTPPSTFTGSRSREIIVVGRLIPWKGGQLAIRAFHDLNRSDASLHFLGRGPDRSRLEKTVRNLGLEGRVHFEGVVPRESVLDRIARARVLLHPAIHDESPITVGEALSLGTPVVCLEHGGPAELVRWWPTSPSRAVRVTNVAGTAKRLAAAIDNYMNEEHPIRRTSLAPSPSYADSLLATYDRVVGRGNNV